MLEAIDGKFCCLGVACVLYEKETGRKLKRRQDGAGGIMGHDLGDQYPVMEWLGLKTGRGNIDGKSNLITLNDGGISFDGIADVIELEPAGLFEE